MKRILGAIGLLAWGLGGVSAVAADPARLDWGMPPAGAAADPVQIAWQAATRVATLGPTRVGLLYLGLAAFLA